MGTFTITQEQPDQNVWLYPTGNGCVVDLSPSAGNNWECVDELKDANDDDNSYVHSSATSILTDLYLTAESVVSDLSGTINYIQVYARAKSHMYPQDVTGIYKILVLLNPSECTDGGMYKSSNMNLTTGYSNFSYIWTTNPSTSAIWNWDDIEDLQIGIQCSSPTLTNYLVSSTFRPSAAGDKTELLSWSKTAKWGAINWECVDDVNPDGNNSVVFHWDEFDGGILKSDLYNIPNHTTEVGPIAKVSVFYLCNKYPDLPDGVASCGVKTGGTEYWEDLHEVPGLQWTLYSYDWSVNPSTGTAWSWSQIDSLQIGVRLRNTDSWIQCTQVYAVVYYYAALNPDIRTTQVYMKINYDSEVTCTLNKPTEISVDHDRNLKMLNFWSGNRAVFDIGRNKKTLVMTGMQTGPSACTEMQCIKAMGKYGGPITTSGIGGVLDSTFRIISFGWKKVTEAPETYEWILELEYEYLDEIVESPV